MRKRKYQRKRLVRGDQVVMFVEPKSRSPIRIDRTMPSTYEEYVRQREEREHEVARSELFAALRSGDGTPSTSARSDSDANDLGVDSTDGGLNDDTLGEEQL